MHSHDTGTHIALYMHWVRRNVGPFELQVLYDAARYYPVISFQRRIRTGMQHAHVWHLIAHWRIGSSCRLGINCNQSGWAGFVMAQSPARQIEANCIGHVNHQMEFDNEPIDTGSWKFSSSTSFMMTCEIFTKIFLTLISLSRWGLTRWGREAPLAELPSVATWPSPIK